MGKFDKRGLAIKAGQLLRPLNKGKKPRAEKYLFQEVRLPVSILPQRDGSKFKSAGKYYQISRSGALVRINKKRRAGRTIRNANEKYIN